MGLRRNQGIHQIISIVVLSLLFSVSATPMSDTVSKKLDQELVPQIPETNIMCGTCPCVNPCVHLPPPPPPPPPLPPPSPPPPPPPKTTYCTPQTPPPPRFVYVTGEPGELSSTDSYGWRFYSTAEQNAAKKWLLLVGCGLLGLLIIW